MKKISWDSISKQKDPAEAAREQQLREARSAAIRYIGIAARSAGAVRTFLERVPYPNDIIADVIPILVEDGYLDDRRPARRIMRERTGARSESQAALRGRLARQGVSEDVVEGILEDMVPDEASAADLVRSRYSRDLQGFSGLDREARRRLIGKIGRFMQSRGYSTRIIRKAVATVLAEAGADPDDSAALFETADD